VDRGGFAFQFGQLQQFERTDDALTNPIEPCGDGFQLGALLAERLRLVRRIPDFRVFEFPGDFG
jgi:hypothetical protein